MNATGLAMRVLYAALLSGPIMLAQAEERQPPCLECHRPRDTTIDPTRFARSVHASLDCAVCHDGFEKFPHSGRRAAMPDCVDCHSGPATPPIDFDQIAAGVRASVHVKVVDPAFRCSNCHSPHYFIPASRMSDAAEATVASNESCLGCHAAADTAADKRLAFGKLAEKHRLLFHAELHLQRSPCIACHTSQQSMHDILPKSAALSDCSGCHTENSLLVTKLYVHLVRQERAERGWVNAILFNNAYLTGATRNRWLDWGALLLAAVAILGVAAHGAGRWFFTRLRSKS